jgi:hypothetical protein
MKKSIAFIALFSSLIFLFSCTNQEGLTRATLGDMRSIAAGLGAYITDNSVAPERLSDLQPFYMKVVPLQDGWGTDYIYRKMGSDLYVLISCGSDEKFDYIIGSAGKSTEDGKDIIVRDGEFIQIPTMVDLKKLGEGFNNVKVNTSRNIEDIKDKLNDLLNK